MKNKTPIEKQTQELFNLCKELISSTDLQDLKDLCNSTATYLLDEKTQVFIEFCESLDHFNEGAIKELWLFFTVESSDNDEEPLDEQDTIDLSDESIRFSIKELLERYYN